MIIGKIPPYPGLFYKRKNSHGCCNPFSLLLVRVEGVEPKAGRTSSGHLYRTRWKKWFLMISRLLGGVEGCTCQSWKILWDRMRQAHARGMCKVENNLNNHHQRRNTIKADCWEMARCLRQPSVSNCRNAMQHAKRWPAHRHCVTQVTPCSEAQANKTWNS